MHNNNSPVIVLGMHRSGTSILAEVLSKLGVFVGKNLNSHHEAKFFMDLNDELLLKIHAFWDTPINVLNLYENQSAMLQLTKMVKGKVRSFEFVRKFFGVAEYYFGGNHEVWGWKDPRNLLFIPLYNEIFPKAKYIYISRNGVDVARSLQYRERGRTGGRLNKTKSIRCRTMNEAFNLWQEYGQIYEVGKGVVDSANLLELRYEDMLDDPQMMIKKVINFFGNRPIAKYAEHYV